ncbi:TPA: hypothetical protein ACYSGT_006179 [Pseudomonas aeruginosa]
MFGWIKRRLLARKCRKALQSVENYRAARAAIMAVRQSEPPRPPAYSPVQLQATGGFLLVGSDVDTVRLQAELQRHTKLPVLRTPGCL